MKICKRWTDEEDQVLVQLIQEYPHNKTKAFEEAALRLNRTSQSCLGRWYYTLSNPTHRKYVGTTFMVISRKSKYDNRTIPTKNNRTSSSKVKKGFWLSIFNIFKR